ncbi:MAG: hypothetical protein ABFS22_00910 [Pseudomonadota bacterium]
MTAMVAGYVILIIIRHFTHIASDTLVLFYLVEMAVKRPHRPVSESANNEPYHKKTFEHVDILHNIPGMSARDLLAVQLSS